MEDALRAGVAVYNAEHYHAAHDAWEDRWLDLAEGSADERLLHGLVQFTAAVHHARTRNWEGATGLARSAGTYLDGLPADHRGVNLDEVRDYLGRLAADPETVERARPPALTVRGEALGPPDLDLDAALVAAPVLAEAEQYDGEAVSRAVAYARDDLAAGEEGSVFVRLVLDFVTEADRRAVVARRLEAHVAERRRREEDVAGLFD